MTDPTVVILCVMAVGLIALIVLAVYFWWEAHQYQRNLNRMEKRPLSKLAGWYGRKQ